jgi:SAM-dependent methyltransferase
LSFRPATEKRYAGIVRHYESCLERHGDSHLGVDWPKGEDAETRYRVMLDLIRRPWPPRVDLLDFGCGASHLYAYIRAHGIEGIEYAGLDLSQKFIELSRRKFPTNRYICADILESATEVPDFDYIVMNGVFTEKRELSFEEMLAYFEQMMKAVFTKARIGVAFNVMSRHVDWEREDLFHLPFDILAAFLKRSLTRNFVMRSDYGLYEYTTYVYR